MGTPFYPPGSDEARDHGCICPRVDNDYGKGIPCMIDGDESSETTGWFITSACPLHGDVIQEAD